MKKLHFLGLIALFAIMASCTPNGMELGLIGTWEYEPMKGYKMTITFENDDSVKMSQSVPDMNGTIQTYTVKGKVTKSDSVAKTITIKWEGDPSDNKITFTYSLDGNKLKLTTEYEDEDGTKGKQSFPFTKK